MSVTFGNGLFVAVASSGPNSRVMTSLDGTTWTILTSPSLYWAAVIYGNGIFVAVATNDDNYAYVSNQVMTSFY
jgi:hypothetical protein